MGKKWFLVIFLLVSLTVLAAIILPRISPQNEITGSFFIEARNLPMVKGLTDRKKSRGLAEVIENHLISEKGDFGIAVKNLTTGETYYLNGKQSFEAASLYKLWVLAVVFDQIEEGKLNEDDLLSQEISILNAKFKIATESAEKAEGKITLTVREAVEKMITVSDNYSALLLQEKVRLSTVKTFLKNNGFSESSIGEPPETTPDDMVLFFEKLYSGELVSVESSEKMLGILKRQALNHKLPKYLPEKTVVAHKTGELGTFSHDAGIVFLESGDYIIVVMTDSDIPKETEEIISLISRSVYGYFNGLLQ